MKQHDDILQQIIRTYGKTSQKHIAIGEIGELLSLFGKEMQNRTNHEAWIDEIADVTIMLRQLAHIHGVDDVEKRISFKIARMQRRLLQEETLC